MILVFDTETTGLPITDTSVNKYGTFYPPTQILYYNTSRLVELAYIIYDENKKEIKRYNSLVIPTFEINNSEIHGITTEEATKNGKELRIVLQDFYQDLQTVNKIVAHNALFDINVVASECYRLQLNDIGNYIVNKLFECTINICMNVYKRRYKLQELYPKLTGKEWIQLHRALDDVEKCAEVYFILKN